MGRRGAGLRTLCSGPSYSASVVESQDTQSARGRPASINKDDVVRGALAVAERVGLANLTMSLLAQELHVSAMTAYRYVTNKQELCDLVIDTVLARVCVPDGGATDWIPRMTALQTSARRELATVHGVLEVVRSRGATPEAVRLADGVISILRDAGFGSEEATIAFNVIYTYMAGQLDLDNGDPGSGRADLEAMAAFSARTSQPSNDEVFVYGLETVLRGLTSRLDEGRV